MNELAPVKPPEGPQFLVEQYRPKTVRRFTFQDMETMAKYVVQSRLFKGIDTVPSAMTLMLLCDAEGIHPIQALRRYDIIDGRPALKSGAMLADFQARGGKIKWITLSDTKAEAEFHARGLVEPVTVSYTIEEARRAGLTSKQNWIKYPKDMLKARCITRGVNLADPAITGGMYSPEEIQDFEKPVQVEAEIVGGGNDTPKTLGESGGVEVTPVYKHNGPLEEHLAQAKKNRENGLISALAKSKEIAEEVNSMDLPIEEKLDLIQQKTKEELKKAMPKPLAMNHPTVCDEEKCDAVIMFYKSSQDKHLGRYYAQCQFAHDAIEKAITQGTAVQKANALYSSHYRKWAEPPAPPAEPTPPESQSKTDDSSGSDATNVP